MEARPDLVSYNEGASLLENWLILKTGGVTRRVGTRFVAEVKNSAKDAVLWPFEPSSTDANVIEVGDQYVRFFKNKQPVRISAGAPPYEIAAPYTEDQLRRVHFTESVDVLFSFLVDVQQQQLSRLSDANWTFLPTTYNPPPSFEADTDISGGTATLTPGATVGSNVLFHASAAVFLEGDVGRIIQFGSSRAVIKSFGASAGDSASPNDDVRADILTAFPNTNPIPAGQWFMQLSPQATLDPNVRAPTGAVVTLVASLKSFRAADVGKFIAIYGGVVRVDFFDSATQVRGELLAEMSGTADTNPTATPAWTLEVSSWSVASGFPRTGELFQGRLGQASTHAQKATWWLSAPDDFNNYVLAIAADAAVEYTMAARALNQIEWLADNVNLFIGTTGTEHIAKSGAQDAPIGGDKIPLVERISTYGSASIQPVVFGRRLIFVDHSGRLILVLAFNWEADGFEPIDLTGASEHVTESGVRLGPIAAQRRPYPISYFVRNDGQLIALTYNEKEKVIGFTRFVTDGTFEAVAVIPQPSAGDQLWVIVKRTVNGQVKRYVEVFDDLASEVSGRAWDSLQTDCAKIYDLAGVSTTVLTGLEHLEGKVVDVVADGDYTGQYTVTAGQITLIHPAFEHVEVGLHYGSPGATMRPSVEGMMVEGVPRSWTELWTRVRNTRGGKINGSELQYPPTLPPQILFTGDIMVSPPSGGTTDERVMFEQHLPYPMTVLGIFGELKFGT